MFTLEHTADHKRFLRSSLLQAHGLRHAFTTSDWDIKTPAQVRGLLAALQLGTPRMRMGKQVHGCTVTLRAADTPDAELPEADAHLSDDPDEAVVVRTADCVPILVGDAEGRVVGAVHAGWRGLNPAAPVIGHAIVALRRRLAHGHAQAGSIGDEPAPAARLVAAVGPCISLPHYEVGEEVAARFRTPHPQAVRDAPGRKPHLDLRRVAVEQLITAGIQPQDIDVYPGCTFDQPSLLHSHRRASQAGRPTAHLAACIAPGQARG